MVRRATLLPVLVLVGAAAALASPTPQQDQQQQHVLGLPSQSRPNQHHHLTADDEQYRDAQVWRVQLPGGSSKGRDIALGKGGRARDEEGRKLGRMVMEAAQSLNLDIWHSSPSHIDILIPNPSTLSLLQSNLPQSLSSSSSSLTFEPFIPSVSALISTSRVPTASDGPEADPLPLNISSLHTPFHDNYHPLTSISDFLDALVERWPERAQVVSLGKSAEGRDIVGVKLHAGVNDTLPGDDDEGDDDGDDGDSGDDDDSSERGARRHRRGGRDGRKEIDPKVGDYLPKWISKLFGLETSKKHHHHECHHSKKGKKRLKKHSRLADSDSDSDDDEDDDEEEASIQKKKSKKKSKHSKKHKTNKKKKGKKPEQPPPVPPNPNPPSERKGKEFFLMGGQHAREWVSPSTVLYFAHYLLLEAERDQEVLDLLKAFTFTIVPTINPDGYVYSQEHSRLWKKTRQDVGSKTCKGIDINANWGYQWASAVPPSILSNPCSETYPGEEAFSAVETKVVSDYLMNTTMNVRAFVDIHSYGQLFMFPYSYSCEDFPKDAETLMEAGLGVAKALKAEHGTQYKVGESCDLVYRMAGDAIDWAYGQAGIRFSYSAELRDTGTYGFLLPPHLIRPTVSEVTTGLVYLAKFIKSNEAAA